MRTKSSILSELLYKTSMIGLRNTSYNLPQNQTSKIFAWSTESEKKMSKNIRVKEKSR